MNMVLNKTQMAHDAILSRSNGMRPLERRVLILADGKRSENKLVEMLGHDAKSVINRMLDEGYLVKQAEQGSSGSDQLQARSVRARMLAPDLSAVKQSLTAVAKRFSGVEANPLVVRVDEPSPKEQVLRRSQSGDEQEGGKAKIEKRSLAICKMYILDILQLVRSPDSASLAASIQACVDEDALVTHLIEALRHVQELSGSGMAGKVSAQLNRSLPESYLHLLTNATD